MQVMFVFVFLDFSCFHVVARDSVIKNIPLFQFIRMADIAFVSSLFPDGIFTAVITLLIYQRNKLGFIGLARCGGNYRRHQFSFSIVISMAFVAVPALAV